MPSLNQRLQQLVNVLFDGNASKFSKALGIPQQRISRLFNTDKRSNKYPVVTTDILVAITNIYVDINTRWLLIGEGEMYLDKSNNSHKDTSSEIQKLKRENDELKKTIFNQSELVRDYPRLNQELAKQRQIIEELQQKVKSSERIGTNNLL